MGSAVWSQTFVMAHAYVFKLDHHWFKYRLLPVRYKSFTVADEELWPIGLLEKINEFWFEESINNFHTQNRKHWKSVIPKSAYKWSTTCEAYKTRNNQRAQTSDNAYVRSVKQSGQAWNSLTKAAKITKKTGSMIRNTPQILSVIPWIIFDLSWKFHQNPFVCISAMLKFCQLFLESFSTYRGNFIKTHSCVFQHTCPSSLTKKIQILPQNTTTFSCIDRPWYHFRPIPENPLQSIKKTFFQ